MDYALSYLKKYTNGPSYIRTDPSESLKYIVAIPAYLETRLTHSLVSLFSCTPPGAHVEVIIVFNWPENEQVHNVELSLKIITETEAWIENHTSPWIKFHCIVLPGVPERSAGVGFARKTAMDEAVRRFFRAGQQDGIIVSFDADSTCDPDYFTCIESHFINSNTDGCSIYFEHPLSGSEFSEDVYKGIAQYELHLRYYLSAIRSTGFPNAYHTVGSAFAVRAKSYCRQGGMNTRKAGEDFYFLQKLFDLENFSELNSTKVIPSPRPSMRVPFGTGAAVTSFLNDSVMIRSYDPCLFIILKAFFTKITEFYNDENVFSETEDILGAYLNSVDFSSSLKEIRNNSATFNSFRKRFFRYFNMFRIMKFLNFARTKYPDLPVNECAGTFLANSGIKLNNLDTLQLLEMFRKSERKVTPQL